MNKKAFQEQDIIRLLNRWGKRGYVYSPDLQSKRRSAFLAAGASLLLHGAGKGGGSTSGGESLSAASHAAAVPMAAATKVTLGILSTVILGLSSYVGAIVYENRDVIRDFIRGEISTLVQESPTPLPTDTAIYTPILMTETPTPSPTGTLEIIGITGTVENQNGGATPQSTPTKPGLHLGQTKTPKPVKTPKH
jgi:hypothetical protein